MQRKQWQQHWVEAKPTLTLRKRTGRPSEGGRSALGTCAKWSPAVTESRAWGTPRATRDATEATCRAPRGYGNTGDQSGKASSTFAELVRLVGVPPAAETT